MRIGIVSNSDLFIPLAYTLAAQQLQVYLFYSPSADVFAGQRVTSFIAQSKLPCSEERNKDKDLYKWLHERQLDVCFLLGYGRLIDLDRVRKGTRLLNIHFGTLPAFRGPLPVFWQLKIGGEKIGLVIHELSRKFDQGAIVWSKEVDNQPQYTSQSVNQLFSQLCVEGAFHILRLLLSGLPLPALAQTGKPGYQKRPELSDILIHWNRMSAREICNLIRACNPWNRGALTVYRGAELKLLDAREVVPTVAGSHPPAAPGTIVYTGERLEVACADGKTIGVNMLLFQDAFLPAYETPLWGFESGQELGR